MADACGLERIENSELRSLWMTTLRSIYFLESYPYEEVFERWGAEMFYGEKVSEHPVTLARHAARFKSMNEWPTKVALKGFFFLFVCLSPYIRILFNIFCIIFHAFFSQGFLEEMISKLVTRTVMFCPNSRLIYLSFGCY